MLRARVTFILAVLLTLLTSYLTAEPEFSDWSVPVNLGAVVNSAFNDQAPGISKNGLSLYFTSDRPGGFGTNDLWVSQRESSDHPWGIPVNLGGVINTTATEWRPSLSRDEHWLIFSSNRVGGNMPGLDIWASYREHIHDDFGGQVPVNIGKDGINLRNSQNNASYLENDDTGIPQLFVASNVTGGPGGFDLYVSEPLPGGDWGPLFLIPELSTSQQEVHVSVRFDGLEIFFARGIPPGGFDLWTSTRKTVLDPWSDPVNLGPLVNSATLDEGPHIAPDRRSLYFDSTRSGGFGGRDLWMTSRTKDNRGKAGL
jgi:hypothetical protein